MKVLLHREIPIVLEDETDDVYASVKYELDTIRFAHPEYEALLYSIQLHTLSDDTKLLVVRVTDPDKGDWRENLKVAIAIIVLGTLLFFIGLYG